MKALLTGTSRGLGQALAQLLLENGWSVFCLARDINTLAPLISNFQNTCIPIEADITNPESEELIRNVIREHGGELDLLINNAGNKGRSTSIMNLDLKEIDDLLQVHCLGTARVTKACIDGLLRSSQPCILNVSSRLGSLTKTANGDFSSLNMSYAYRIAKAAMNMLTVNLHNELIGKGIRVMAVHPGVIGTGDRGDQGKTLPSEAAKALFSIICNQDGSNLYLDEAGKSLPW